MRKDRADELPDLQAKHLRFSGHFVAQYQRPAVLVPRIEAGRQVDDCAANENGDAQRAGCKQASVPRCQVADQCADRDAERPEKRVVDIVDAQKRAARENDGSSGSAPRLMRLATGQPERRRAGEWHQVDDEREMIDVAIEGVWTQREERTPYDRAYRGRPERSHA